MRTYLLQASAFVVLLCEKNRLFLFGFGLVAPTVGTLVARFPIPVFIEALFLSIEGFF
jgi:hypothetical protein